MKIAVIADIHSNRPALEAVLTDLSRHRIDRLVHLGDAFNGPIDPAGVAALLRPIPMLHVRGNGERMVLSDDPNERKSSANYARERLTADDLEWIRSWPRSRIEPDFLACHGSPESDIEYLLEEVLPGGVRLRRAADVLTRLGPVESGLVLCGHTHVPRFVRLNRRCAVLNPGSVGLPAYADDSPSPHRMETGSPEARYALAELSVAGWSVSHLAVPYDHEKAAAIAEAEGFVDWAVALRTGYAK